MMKDHPSSGPKRSRALLILAHGAKSNADSSRPARQLTEALRKRGLFDEVLAAFWREQPEWHQALTMVHSEDIFVIPFFMSDGYFTRKIIPRELKLSGPLTYHASRRILYGEPVGTHPSMTRAIHHAAVEVMTPIEGTKPSSLETTLILVGHGTLKHDQSGEALLQQVALLKKENVFAEVLPAFMEQPPFDRDVLSIVRTRFVTVIPFFTSDGLHSKEDVPVNMGFATHPLSWNNPVSLGSRFPTGPEWLWYADAIGSEPYMAEVILDRCRDLETRLQPTNPVSAS